MSVICSKFLLKLVIRTWIFLKLSHVSTLSILDRGNPSHFQTAIIYLADVEVLWQTQKFMSYCTVFLYFILNLRAILRVQAPRGLYLEGRFIRRVFCATSLGGSFSGFYGILIKSVEGFSFFKTSENVVIRYHLICLIRGPIFYATSHHLHDGVILLLRLESLSFFFHI